MRTKPLVSVIIPTYNRAGVICETIDNVLQQTYTDYEVIVVDDGSADDTQSTLHRYGNRIRVFAQPNAGAAAARNRGAALAKGEIIAFQDSDDLWEPMKLERQVALLEKLGPSSPCCLCNSVMRFADRKPFTAFDVSLIHSKHEEGLWVNAPEVLATRFVLFNQAIAIRREAWEKVGGFDERLKYLEDYDLPLRLALEGPWGLIREPLVVNRVAFTPHTFSQQAMKDPIGVKECEVTIFRRALEDVKKHGGNTRVEKQLRRRLRTFRLGLHAARLAQSHSPGARFASRLLKMFDRYYHIAFRRSPWFPKVITLPVEAARGKGINSEKLAAALP